MAENEASNSALSRLNWSFLVGRPGLDPGTLGLKERFRLSSPFVTIHLSSSGRV
jgi:hypothetical protein